jgi:small-conductance mechanosensitive channel
MQNTGIPEWYFITLIISLGLFYTVISISAMTTWVSRCFNISMWFGLLFVVLAAGVPLFFIRNASVAASSRDEESVIFNVRIVTGLYSLLVVLLGFGLFKQVTGKCKLSPLK